MAVQVSTPSVCVLDLNVGLVDLFFDILKWDYRDLNSISSHPNTTSLSPQC